MKDFFTIAVGSNDKILASKQLSFKFTTCQQKFPQNVDSLVAIAWIPATLKWG